MKKRGKDQLNEKTCIVYVSLQSTSCEMEITWTTIDFL